jgi:hypothetical protein
MQPDPAEPRRRRGLRGVDAHTKLLARRHAARRIVGRLAVKWAIAFSAAGVGGESDQVQPEQLLKRRLEFADFGVDFKEQSGFGLRVQVAGGYLLAQLQSLPVNRGELVGHRDASLTLVAGFSRLEATVDPGEAGCEPCGRAALHQFRQPRNARVDLDLLIVEEFVLIVERFGIAGAGSSFSGRGCIQSCCGLRGGRHRPQMIACGGRSAQGRRGAAVLRPLLAPAFARNLQVAPPQRWIPCADLKNSVSRKRALGPLSGDVILEALRSPFAGGVVEDFSAFDAREGEHRVDGQGLPGLHSVFCQLLGEDLGVTGGREDLLRNLARNLVVTVAVAHSADEGGEDYLRPLAAHRQYGVVEHALVAPAGKGLLLSFGEAEVHLRAPKLPDAVELVGLQQLVGANQSQRVAVGGGDFILPALAAVQGEQRRARAQATAEVGQQRAVLVVRMRHDHHRAGGGLQAQERLLDGRLTAILGDGQSYLAGFGKGYGREFTLGGGRGRRRLLDRRVSGLLRRQWPRASQQQRGQDQLY